MSNIFDKWNKNIDTEALIKDIEEAKENGGNYKEVPTGNYEVKVEKIELKESKKKDPMLTIWFQITAGDFKGQRIFYNQVITQGFQIHMANEMLRDLATELDVEFKNYSQYNELVLDIFEDISELHYELIYGQNSKGFNTYEIEEVFE